MQPAAKKLLFIGLALGAVVGYREAVTFGLIPRPDALKTLIPLKVETVSATELSTDTANIKVAALPSATPVSGTTPVVRAEIWAWNAQMGWLYANGGPSTTKGSLMDANGVRMSIVRQDDSNKMQADQAAFANSYCTGGSDENGVHFVAIMGDGAAQYIAPLNDQLKKLGDGCRVEVVGSAGYSRGEDKFMGLPEWKADPKMAKGALIAGVVRDGDWNIGMRWAQDNAIPNNPDDRVYDPEALNWVAADTYIDASQKYVANFCEDLPLKSKPSVKKHVCVNGVVTWFPGDEIVAHQRGGLVTLMSTKNAIFQMPAVIIGNAKWDAAHAEQVAGMLAAIGGGGDQLRVNPAALQRAGEISRMVYKEKDANYWASYYKGVSTKDLQGNQIDLGGSLASNLADQFQLFGLSGGPNLFKITYTSWGNVVKQQYPNILKDFPPAEVASNTRYLKMAAERAQNTQRGDAEVVNYSQGPLRNVVGHRDYNITFATGRADILPSSSATLEGIFGEIATSNFKVILHGHTDATGKAASNMELSRSRAQAVADYLQSRGSKAPYTIVAHGQEDPIADNSTEAGRAKNRRVELILGD